MQTYKAPLRDMRFVLHELHDSAALTRLSGLEDVSPELMDSILEEAAKLAEEVLLPVNASGDEIGCVLENGVVRTPKGFKEAYDTVPRRRLDRAGLRHAIWRPGAAGKPEQAGRGDDLLGQPRVQPVSGADAWGVPGDRQPCLGRAERHLSAEDGGWHVVRHDVPDGSPLRHRSGHVAHPRGAAGGRQLQDQRVEDLHQRR